MGWDLVFTAPGNCAHVNPGAGVAEELVSGCRTGPCCSGHSTQVCSEQIPSATTAPSRPLGPATCVPTPLPLFQGPRFMTSEYNSKYLTEPSSQPGGHSSELRPPSTAPPNSRPQGETQEHPWGTGAGTAPGRRGVGGGGGEGHSGSWGNRLPGVTSVLVLGSPNPKGQLSPCRAG